MTVMAAEAVGVEDRVVGNQSLHRIDGLLAGFAHLLLHLEAERLSTDAHSARFKSLIINQPGPLPPPGRGGEGVVPEAAARGRLAPVCTSSSRQ